MNTFQVVGISLSVVFVTLSLLATVRRGIGVRSGVSWAVLWSAAALAIAYPDLTVVFARALGISRGADLVFYCAILGMLIGFFMVYVKLRRIERNITLLARQMALSEASPAAPGDQVPPASSP